MDDPLVRLKTALSARYAIEREIGSGGTATVYLAEDLRHGRKVAIKVLRPELAITLGPKRFLLEVKVTAGLDHPHILPLLDSGEANGDLYYVMPLVEGESLRDRLNREKKLPIDDAIQIAREVADAINFAHDHDVVHRDIKPENILLGAGHARVADFGIARAIGAAGGDRITEVGLALGTPEYMSPEQVTGESALDGRSDIYALGCLLYEMLAGDPPFVGKTIESVVVQHLSAIPNSITKVRSAVPRRVADALTCSLAKAPEDRFSSASDFAQALAPDPREGRSRWQHPLTVAALFGVVSFIVLTVVYSLMVEIGLPGWVIPGASVLLLAGLPIMVSTAVVQRGSGTRTGGVHRWFTWRRAILGGALAFTGLSAVTAIYLSMRTLGIGPVGTLLSTGVLERGNKIILADFENRTDDSTLGLSITEALRVDLSQSRVVNLLDVSVLDDVLLRMEASTPGQLDATTAHEVAQREGGKAVITGEVSRLGSGYVLLASMVSPISGEVLASVRETAADEEMIIGALDRLSASLRDRIGEPLKAIRASPSLARVTTPSLAALRNFSHAQVLRNRGDEQGALALLEAAVAADTAFAMAYRTLGVVVGNLGLSPTRNVEARRKAFEHRDRLTERERLLTMGTYYFGVTGELDAAQAAYEAVVEVYPEEFVAWQNLGSVIRAQHQLGNSEAYYAQAYDRGGSTISLGSLLHVQVALGKFAEAEANLDLMADRHPDATSRLFRRTAMLAYARRDYTRTVAQLQNHARLIGPLARGRALAHIQAVLAIEGKLQEANQYLTEATELFAQANTGRDFLITTTTGASIRFLLAQDADGALRSVEVALDRYPLDSLDPLERPYIDIALFYALTDRPDEAGNLLREWEGLVEPELRRRAEPSRHLVLGAIALSEDRVADAILDLHQALDSEPAMYSQVVLPLLGRAYEANGRADSAIVAYERYLGETEAGFGANATSLLASAHNPDAAWRADTYLRLGKLYEQRGDNALAFEHYGRFVDLLSDADPEFLPRVDAVIRLRGRLAGDVQEDQAQRPATPLRSEHE